MTLHKISEQINGATTGILDIPRGIAELNMSELTDEVTLFDAQLPDPLPEVKVDDGHVTVISPRFAVSYVIKRPESSRIALNSHIPWQFNIGGVKGLYGDLSKFVVKGFEVGGAVDVELTLPAPSGNVAIRFKGGVSKVTLKRPVGTETRLSIKGGATHINFDAQHAGAIGGGMSWQSSGFDEATDRYDIEIDGGATHITVE